ncbi:methyl-accepting chemotaxis protein [Clostridium malenominatum]|uniref:Methyl-accepting chemotaxis protein n=1 Tax=Clostridium malenominatum TaxID=1539 RepID=A0ABN1IR30_9CLOT
MKSHRKRSKNNLNKIGIKLTTILMLLSIIPLIILGYFSYTKTYSVLENKFKITSEQTLLEVNRGLSNYFERFESQLNMLSQNIDFTNIEEKPDSASSLDHLLENAGKSNEDIITSVYYGTISKKFFEYPKTDLNRQFDPTTRPWYNDAIKNSGKITYCDPYKDVLTGKLVITISKTVELNGKLVGVISMDLDASKLSSKLSQTKIGKEGYVYVFNLKGVMLAHPNTELIGTDEATKQSYWEDVYYKIDGYTKYNFNNSNKIGVFTTNEKTSWKLMASLDESEFLNDSLTLRNTTLFLVLISSIICAVISIFISKSLTKNIYSIKGAIEKASEGDLTTTVSVTSKDEFLDLANSFNNMMVSISNLIRNTAKSSQEVLETSSNFVKVSEEVSHSINGMAATMQEIAKGTAEQAASTEEGSLAINEFSDKVSNINQYTMDMDSIVYKTNDITNQGLIIVEKLTEKSKETLTSSLEVGKIVEDVDKSTKDITSITETITQITEQTNLLALNAAIEAARAGEAGRGFSVVAEEIRHLAEQSRDSAKEIKEIINEIQQKSHGAVLAINKANEAVQAQESSVKATEEIFNDILSSMKMIIDKVSGIKNLTTDLDEKKIHLTHQMENISSISEETAAGTEEVSASTEEVAATMEQFVSYANNLKKLALALEDELNKFNI